MGTTNGRGLIPAVGYLRASDPQQETSCADQKAELQKWAAAHGYRIIAWYIDDGKSGGGTADRDDFLRMIADSARGDFRAVICWHSSRFSRGKPREALGWLNDLKENGVDLVTMDKGCLDLDDFGTLLLFVVEAKGNHDFLI